MIGIIVLLAVLIFLHEGGHFLAAKALKIPVKQFALGFGPAIWSITRGETQYRINALPLGGYCAFADDESEAEEGGPTIKIPPEAYLLNRPLWQQTIVVTAGVAANVLIAWVAIVLQLGVAGIPQEKMLDIAKEGVLITSVVGEPAKKAGIKDGDHVMALDGKPLTSTTDFQTHVRAKAGKAVFLTVRRNEPKPGTTLTLEAHPTPEGKIGVAIAPPMELTFRPATGPVELIVESSKRTVQITRAMGMGLWMLVTRQLPLDMVGGPIAIVHMGATTVKDFYQFCMFAAMISLDLAIVNFLPIPGLDGGHILFILYEAIFRRPLPRRIKQSILSFGLILLLSLSVLLIVKDILTLGH